MENIVKNTFVICVWKNLNDWAAQNIFFFKSLHPKMIQCYEAHRSMLSNYFYKNQVVRGTFEEIWRIQIQMYPKTYVELRYGACNLKNEFSAHRLGLVVQLSWRVAPHLPFFLEFWKWQKKKFDIPSYPPPIAVQNLLTNQLYYILYREKKIQV